jgi:hypothetical protein
MSGSWRTWNGGACPVHPEAQVRLRFRDLPYTGREYPARLFRWTHRMEPGDIVEFQVTVPPGEAEK